jgi:hypothetical protein
MTGMAEKVLFRAACQFVSIIRASSLSLVVILKKLRLKERKIEFFIFNLFRKLGCPVGRVSRRWRRLRGIAITHFVSVRSRAGCGVGRLFGSGSSRSRSCSGIRGRCRWRSGARGRRCGRGRGRRRRHLGAGRRRRSAEGCATLRRHQHLQQLRLAHVARAGARARRRAGRRRRRAICENVDHLISCRCRRG